jgi:hypothetical protein
MSLSAAWSSLAVLGTSGGGTMIHARLRAATLPSMRRNSTPTSSSDVDHSASDSSNRDIELGGSN